MKRSLLKTSKALSVFIFLLVLVACKKDKQEVPGKNNPSLVGEWSNIKSLGTGRNQVTQLNLKADGTGRKEIFNTSFSGATTISDEDIKWVSEKDVLKLIFKDGLIDEFKYVINEDANKLTLTNKSGDAKDFF